ncbi:hypothetical protein BH09PSE6_BH09PSE6_02640 [soil metagenome]
MRRWLIPREVAAGGWNSSQEWKLSEFNDSPIRFDNDQEAQQWLRGFDATELRLAVTGLRLPIQLYGLDDEAMLRLIATLLVKRQLYLCPERARTPLPGGGGGGRPAPGPEPKPGPRPLPVNLHWIEIVLKDSADRPVAGEAYRVELPGGEIREGNLNDEGRAYIGNIAQAGSCRVNFPKIDASEWRRA